MPKRIFIIHGWGGHPEEGWFPWLKNELEAKGFEVCAPQLPGSENPRIFMWIPKLIEMVGTPDNHTYFVGHSLGCQAIVRYLQTLPEYITIGGAVFVAGFFKRLTNLGDDPNIQATFKHWFEAPLDLQQVRPHIRKSIAIFSDDDPDVPLDNQDDFRDKLRSKIIIEHNKGHFSPDDGITELPIVLQSVLEVSQ